MALSDLDAIRKKVRRLTQSPSFSQLSVSDLDDYINTFIRYDFPEILRTFNLHKPIIFSLEPNVDTYTIDSVLGDINNYITFNPPVYIAGFKAAFSQSEEEFYNVYPFNSSIQATANSGDGSTFVFSGVLAQVPILPGKVAFTAIGANNDGLILQDSGTPTGILTGDGVGTINYVTGVYSLTFNSAPIGVINSQTVPYSAGRPTSMLFFQNSFTFRPVPDQVYQVQLEAFIPPTELIAGNQNPELNEWWQYIAYGAAKKVLEDRIDTTTLAAIQPEFNRQERLVLRRTIVQLTNERTASIYNGYGTNLFSNERF